MTRSLDKAITRTIQGLTTHTPLDATEAIFAVSELAGTERKLRTAAKAVIKAFNGTDRAAMDEALGQLRKALK